ncbi:HAMP domain-containing sensor histidine kinase [Fuchsiella alkaliacetigena]|uniref:HAMP domain-containing sensor histidine kinase n=1 Tax=Fuchsiella alkaliacetigena TaxID=957042 RepID=UPI00200B6BE6|nr:ATP-binding protein [Fuchsiella alkaliacetigena]MCK8825044.1 cell wall metabolism sensor histidine kinase WalK [Fuchsiella alkaliacetigena]
MFNSLKTKILTSYLILILLITGVAVWSINNFLGLSSAINDIMVENYRSVVAAENMMGALERQDSAQLLFLFGKEERGQELFRESEREFLKWLSRAEDNITIAEEEEIIKRINDGYLKYLQDFDQLQPKYRQDSSQAREFYLAEIMPHFNQVKEWAQELLTVNQEAMVSAQQKANSNANEAVYSTAIVSILAIIFALVFGIYISNLILKPTEKLIKTVKKVGEGDLTQEIKVNSKDEIGELAYEFNQMTERLKEYEEMNVTKLIAEKNKSEAIVKSIDSPIIVTDKEHRIVLLNPIAERLFQISEEEVIGKHFLEVIKEERIFQKIEQVAEEEGLKSDNKQEVLKMDFEEQERYYRLMVTPVPGKEERVNRVITLLDDITHLKEIDDLKSDFVSTASHEFRTPLTSMNMGLSLLLEETPGGLNKNQHDLLAAAYEDCQRLIELVDDLLDLSKIESGEIQIEFDDVDLADLVEASVRPLQKQAQEQQIELLKKIPADLPPVKADPNKIVWVLSNLIGNALRYTKGEGQVKVKANQKGKRVYVSVIDTGIGIPEEYHDKIFDKFVRVKGDAAINVSGTGLGLAIVREIVEAHSGKIWVESEVDQGSTFTFTLPVAK